MQDLTTLSSSSSLTTSNSLSTNNLLSPLFTALGWKDLKPAIVAAEQADQTLALELQQAYDTYSKTPDEAAKQRLQMVLDQAIGELQADLTRVKKLEKEAAKRLAKPQSNSSGYLASWGSWIKQSAQSFFGSDDASLVERYAGIAQQRQGNIAALSRLREGLAAPMAKAQTHVPVAAEQEPIEDIISPLSRRLLQLQGTPVVTQYCYPTGSCDLSNLYDGISGFVLQGEVAGDNSGTSVSSAGDINGDGFTDMLVGAWIADPDGRTNAGKTYVVFGSNQPNAWGSGILDLRSLMDGQRGFMLQGEVSGDDSGNSVSSAGDVNGDGFTDMLVGAFVADSAGHIDAGKTYVVFGSNQTNAWGSGVLNLTSLINGQRGFVLQGEGASDYSGYSVSSAGDINGDGLADMMVGAYRADPVGRTNAGKTYVVFGSNQPNAWGSGTLDLSNLMNGQRGFVLQGEASDDESGISGSSAGDINGDSLTDILVGAWIADSAGRNNTGKTYVVFGSNQPNAWGSGVLNLTSLMDGQRGFVLQGEMAEDESGYSVSSAGDINGDGFTDVLVGAPTADPAGRNNAGKTYVVFGSNLTTAWGTGVLNLTSLMNGQRGFVLQGEAPDDISGVSVSGKGDINGDGLADVLVGANYADSAGRMEAGKSYVVFGSNQTNAWGSGVFNLSSLMDGQRGFVLQGETAADYSGGSVSSVRDINGDGLADILVGAFYADPAGRTDAGKSYVVFGARPAQLWANQLAVYKGQTLILGSQNLNATDSRPISFNVTTVTHGRFEYVSAPGQAINSFNQSQVWAGQVQFVHDGTPNIPSYSVQLGSGIAKLPPQNATVGCYELLANRLTVHQGESLSISNATLDVTVYSAGPVIFTISNLQHGQFLLAPTNTSVTQFTQAELLAGDVLFAHDNSSVAPGYNVTISDASLTLITSPANVTFYRRPVWLSNQLTLTQGDSLLLNAQHINVTEDASPSNVLFTINALQHGQFQLAPANNTVTAFSQQQLLDGQVLFVHDNTGIAPSYQLALNDSYFTLPPEPAAINFTPLPPILGNNTLTVLQGRNKTLSTADLSASDPNLSYNVSSLVFKITEVQHGQFRVQGVNATQFTQGQVAGGKVAFAHDDSTTSPSYKVTVDNGYRNTTPQAANISFDARPVLFNNRLTIDSGESVVLAITDLRAIDDITLSGDLLFRVSNVQHGYFSQLQAPNTSITQFLQQRVRDAEIQFQHDGSLFAPAYTMTAIDGSGLESYPQQAQINFKSSGKANEGIDLTKLYASVSSVGGAILAIAGYFWWRKRVASHRRGYDFANSLRKAANLEYHDFMRFDGEVYKTKVDAFVAQLKLPHRDFYDRLTLAEKKSFAVCVAAILQERDLLKASDCGDAIYGWFFGFSVGWSRQLNVKEFEKQISEIAQAAVEAWQKEPDPLTRWPYYSPTVTDKAKAWCCPRPSQAGAFAPRNSTSSRSEQGIALSERKMSTPSSPSAYPTKEIGEGDVVIPVSSIASSSSPRFFSSSSASTAVTEDRLKAFEQQMSGQLKQVSSLQHDMQEMAGSLKTAHEKIGQLEAETRPLLMGITSSSSS